ncbi:MAG TPA: hypothetical protein PKY82_21240 [Pyrinomonadaceae bacterium]|nr:hypothetical protein [Pyrinomonadaceae bacterium]
MKAKLLLSMGLVCLFFNQIFAQTNSPIKKSVSTSPVQTLNNSNVLPIRKVILYSNGMVYIERRGTVSGNTDINLSFKQSQVDDVLKSMVVLDLGQGQVGAVSYNSSVPAAARTGEIPFNIESESESNAGGMAGVLSQLQGAKVLVTSGKGSATGSILNVAKRQKVIKSKDEETTLPLDYSLVIASDSGEISSFDLADIRSVKLLDEETKHDVNEFSNATASARRRDAKTINISSEGNGQREMIVSYTVSAPIWKTSYRVVLDAAGKPFFQGWAIVDNVSEEDWKNVQLSLVSGSPISFIQPLQNPLYRHRPVIEIPDDLSLEPQIYDPNGGGSGRGNGYGIGDGSGSGSGIGSGSGSGRGNGGISFDEPAKVVTSVSELLSSENSGVQTAAKGVQFGDLFEYRIQRPVSVNRNRSALIPIVQTKMEGERVSIYRESNKQDRPMSGILLNNTSNLTFEGGAMTILDGEAYAGEALMERLKPKEKRLISFAIDLGTLFTVKNEQVREPAKLVKAVNGVFQIHYFYNDKKSYTISNQTDQKKVIYLEHPIREKWILSADTQKPIESTQNFYRFRIELQPFENKLFTINEKQPLMDSYRIAALKVEDLDLFIKQRYIDEATKQQLMQLINLRDEMAQIDKKIAELNEEEKIISNDQSRLRENIEALAKTPEAKQLITRYISKANDQETRVEAITKERKELKSQREQVEAKLATEIKNFELK